MVAGASVASMPHRGAAKFDSAVGCGRQSVWHPRGSGFGLWRSFAWDMSLRARVAPRGKNTASPTASARIWSGPVLWGRSAGPVRAAKLRHHALFRD